MKRARLLRFDRSWSLGPLGVLCTLLIALPGALRAQDSVFSDAWRWAGFTREDGLPDNHILRVVEAGETPWALTARGPAWYDGYQWHAIQVDTNASAMPVFQDIVPVDSAVLVLAGRGVLIGDTSGFTWVSLPPGVRAALFGAALGTGQALVQTGDSTLYRFTLPATLEPLPDQPGRVAHPGVRGVFRTATGRTWISTADGLYRYRDAEWVRGPVVARPGAAVEHLAESPDGLLVAHVLYPPDERGIWEWGGRGRPRYRAGEGRARVGALTTTADGRILAFHVAGAVRIRGPNGWRTLIPRPDEMREITDLVPRANGDLWVGTRRGLFLHHGSSTRWTVHRHGFADGRNRVNDILRARDGSLWQATAGGVEITSPDGATRTIRGALGQSFREVTGVIEDIRGHIWVSSGATFRGAYRWDGASWRHFGPAEGLRNRVHRMALDRRGRTWFLELPDGEPAAAVVYDGQRFARRDDHPFLEAGVYAMAQAADGTLWFGTRRGLLRWRNGAWDAWGADAGVGSPGVFTLAPAPDGTVWFSSRVRGVSRLEGDGTITRITAADGLPDDGVWEIEIEPDGTVWLGTSGGLVSWRDGDWSVFPVAAGLVNATVWPVLVTPDEVVVGTIGGLAVLSRAEREAPAPRVFVDEPVVVGRTAIVRWRPEPWWGAVPRELIQTRHRLNGGTWSAWSMERELRLIEEAAGAHEIEVQAKGLFGRPGEPARAGFRIAPPFLLRPSVAIPVGTLVLAFLLVAAAAWRRRRHDTAALRASESRMRTLLEHAPEALVILDVELGRFVDVNRNAEELYKLPRETLLTLGPADVSPERQPDGRLSEPLAREWVQQALAGGAPVFEWTHRDATGRDIPCEIRLVRLPGPRPQVRGSVTDISERLTIEHQLRHAQKMEAVGELTGGISHDFNNILTAILAQTDVVRGGLPEGQDTLRDELTEISRMARRGGALVQKLMAFARREPLDLRPLDLADVVRDLSPMLRRVLPESIDIHVEVDDGETWIRGEGGALEQILLNLATNARDAMPRGGALRLEVSPVRLAEEDTYSLPAGSYVRLVVRDTGIGMDDQTRERVFEPFFTTKPTGQGTGLGLAMVYGLLERHGGAVDVQSTPGTGTTVTLLFPATRPGKRRISGGTVGDVPGGSETVLVVEDEAAIRRAASRLLERKGYTVHTAADGALALELLSGGTAVDLVVTDVVMPNMGGWHLYQAVRERGCRAPFLFMSGYTARDGAAPDIDPALPFLPKPWVAADFLRLVRDVLDGTDRT